MTNAATVLVTGFGPFPGVAENISGALAQRVAAAAGDRFPNGRFVADTLPTEWEAAPRRLAALLAEFAPQIVLHFGVSRLAAGFVVETSARNKTVRVRDACGSLPEARCLDGGAPSLAVTAPAGKIVANLLAAQLPARLSQDAGGYLCNAVFYHSLRRAGLSPGPRLVCFVHIPAAFSRRFGWREAVGGGLVVIASCRDESSGDRPAGWAERS